MDVQAQEIARLLDYIRGLEASNLFHERDLERLQGTCRYQRQMLWDVLARLPWGRLNYELKRKIEAHLGEE